MVRNDGKEMGHDALSRVKIDKGICMLGAEIYAGIRVLHYKEHLDRRTNQKVTTMINNSLDGSSVKAHSNLLFAAELHREPLVPSVFRSNPSFARSGRLGILLGHRSIPPVRLVERIHHLLHLHPQFATPVRPECFQPGLGIEAGALLHDELLDRSGEDELMLWEPLCVGLLSPGTFAREGFGFVGFGFGSL